ncbi:MAG: uridylate kinase [Methylococcaceae bacterium]|nr:uridylate kinase [Methylococcaceae bacterium]
MIVVKLGGSLLQSGALLDCLGKIEHTYQDQSVVIVPGGGAFADQVRAAQKQWQFDDRTAHVMALLAMQQMACLINGIYKQFAIAGSLAEIKTQARSGQTLIWSPDLTELDAAGVRASWDVTSDTLAAWLAAALSASDLVLVKSAPIISGTDLPTLAAQEIVDKAFCETVQNAPFTIHVINTQTTPWPKPKTHLI